MLDVSVIGSTAAAHDTQRGKLFEELRVLFAELGRIADVETRARVELRVASAGSIGSQAAHPLVERPQR